MRSQPTSFIQRATNCLNNIDKIKEISNLVKYKYGETLKIGFPNYAIEKDKIYFILDTDNTDLSILRDNIKKALTFDYANDDDEEQDVILLNAHSNNTNNIDRLVKDIRVFSPENFSNIQEFLYKYYDKFLAHSISDRTDLTEFNPSSSNISKEQILARKLIEEHSTEIQKLSPPEKEELIRHFCKSIGVDVQIRPSAPAQRV